MQHVLRRWERQSDGSEYKKKPAPDPAEGAYSAPANRLVGGRGWLSPPQEPNPPLSALRASPLLPTTPKLVPTPLSLGLTLRTFRTRANTLVRPASTYLA